MIVLLGGSGFVGSAFQRCLTKTQLPFHVLSRSDVDYSKRLPLLTALREMRPTFLINVAGYTGKPNVDACELHKAECLAGNGVLPGTVRSVCEELQLPWGHISSGCIYTGTLSDGGGFTETDPPNFSFRQNNCSFYSGCKALGEEVLSGAENCFIWRLRIPFDHRDSARNYISKIIRYDKLLDASNSLSQLEEFVQACVDCWINRIEFGIYNLTNPGVVTTRDVVEIVRRNGLTKREFRFFDSEAEFMQIAANAPRSNCVLDSSKALNAGLHLTPVHDAIEAAVRKWVTE